MEETFDRGNLSGHVYDMGGDMVKVRFSEASDHAGKAGTFRIVVRVDGSLAIDPSGLTVPQRVRDDQERRAQLEFGAKRIGSGSAEEIEEAQVVEEIAPPKPMDPRVVDEEGRPSIGSKLQIQIGRDNKTIYVGEVLRTDDKRVMVKFEEGLGLVKTWYWEMLTGENRIVVPVTDFTLQREDGPDDEQKMWGESNAG